MKTAKITVLCLVLLGALGLVSLADEGERTLKAKTEGAELALLGHDPVMLVKGKEVAGDEGLAVERGRFRYLFANEDTLHVFQSDPERFEIQKDGHCAAMPSATGYADNYAVYDERIYVFGTAGCREEFLADPASFAGEMESRKVAILVYDGVELLDFAGPGEVFAAAGYHGGGFEVFTVAATAEPVTSQGFVEVVPRYAISESPRPDLLVVPGGGVKAVLQSAASMAWIRETAKEAEVVLSVCNGALVLAKAGLLDGLEATTHHGSIEALKRWAPETTVHADRRFVDNGRVVTAAGVSAGIDASLHLVARLTGSGRALQTASYMEYPWQEEDGEERLAASN